MARTGKDIKLANTELFQSINPLFIVVLTLIFVPLFTFCGSEEKSQLLLQNLEWPYLFQVYLRW